METRERDRIKRGWWKSCQVAKNLGRRWRWFPRGPVRLKGLFSIYSPPPTILFPVNLVKATYCITPRPQSFPSSYLYIVVCVWVRVQFKYRPYTHTQKPMTTEVMTTKVNLCAGGLLVESKRERKRERESEKVAWWRLLFTTMQPLYATPLFPIGVTARLLINTSSGWQWHW